MPLASRLTMAGPSPNPDRPLRSGLATGNSRQRCAAGHPRRCRCRCRPPPARGTGAPTACWAAGTAASAPPAPPRGRAPSDQSQPDRPPHRLGPFRRVQPQEHVLPMVPHRAFADAQPVADLLVQQPLGRQRQDFAPRRLNGGCAGWLRRPLSNTTPPLYSVSSAAVSAPASRSLDRHATAPAACATSAPVPIGRFRQFRAPRARSRIAFSPLQPPAAFSM